MTSQHSSRILYFQPVVSRNAKSCSDRGSVTLHVMRDQPILSSRPLSLSGCSSCIKPNSSLSIRMSSDAFIILIASQSEVKNTKPRYMHLVVPGHKGPVVGDRQDMIRRTIESTKPKLVQKRKWDPHTKSTYTRSYRADTGEPYNVFQDRLCELSRRC